MSIIITGGSGFIGSNFINKWISSSDEPIINIDKLTYASESQNLEVNSKNYIFYKEDINNYSRMVEIFNKHKPRAIINFAAETHVDNSIEKACPFVESNVNGTYSLLKCSLNYYTQSLHSKSNSFIFFQISTDEVYGSLSEHEEPFTENSTYNPRNPYSACKASADHLVMSFYNTYNLPCVISHCGNNYGEGQHCEKLIPTVIRCALNDKPIPIYGDGKNIRDWIYVKDHCNAIFQILYKNKYGTKYNIGSSNEITNISLTKTICKKLDKILPRKDGKSYQCLIKFVEDRKGHDMRYALNCKKINEEIDWVVEHDFESSLNNTVKYYCEKYSP